MGKRIPDRPQRHAALRPEEMNQRARDALSKALFAFDEFMDIHLQRYYDHHGRELLRSDNTLKYIIDKIIDACIEFSAPRFPDLLRMTPAEQAELFASVQLDYTDIGPQTADVPAALTDEDDPTGEMGEWDQKVQRAFGFLPERWRGVLMLALPAMQAVGISAERFKEIVDGSPISDEEKELFCWVYDLFEALAFSHKLRDTALENRLLEEAIDIAHRKLDEAVIVKTVGDVAIVIWQVLESEDTDGENEENARPRRKRRRKR